MGMFRAGEGEVGVGIRRTGDGVLGLRREDGGCALWCFEERGLLCVGGAGAVRDEGVERYCVL